MSSAAGEVAGMLAREMAEKGVDTLAVPIFDAGPAHLMMVGPHNDAGLCWCQPRVERVVCVNTDHGTPDHYVFVHDGRVS